MSQMDAALAPMGFKASDVLDFDIKIKNKSKQDDGRWLVETETTVKAKKSLKDFNEDQQMGLGMMFGKFEKGGQIGQAQMGTAHMSKGDNGWILTN